MKVRLIYGKGDAINPVRHPERPRPSRSALKLAESLVINPQSLRRDDEGESGSYVYVIPDWEGVADAIQPLVDWRKRQGWPTQVITVATDANNVQVRRAIVKAYEEWDIPPETITLVGEADRRYDDFVIPTWDVGNDYMWETDHKYVMLEGEDILPEAAIGRISCDNVGQLRDIVAKILGYEKDPYMDNTAWFTHAALMSNDSRTGYSSIYVQRWARELLLEVGFTEPDTFYFIHNNPSGHDFIENSINSGISLFNYRGWGQFNGDWVPDDAIPLRNGRMLPLVLMPTCNSADFADHVLFDDSYTEFFLWADGGGIAAIGSSGLTHTNYNNVFDGGIINGFYRDRNWQIGWALNQGKLELYRHFGTFDDVPDPKNDDLKVWESMVFQMNLIGDAGTELWTAVPLLTVMDYPDTVSLGANRITVLLRTEDDELPVEDAMITLMQLGEPVGKGLTDHDGSVEFAFTPGELAEGTLDLTATKHDMHPRLTQIVVRKPDTFVGVSSYLIDDDQAGRSEGNEDGLPNPGETIELRCYLANFGNETPVEEITANLSVVMGDVEIVNGEVDLDQAPAIGDSALATFLIRMGQDCWDGRRTLLEVTVSSEGEDWKSSVEFQITASNLEVAAFEFDPPAFNPGDTVWVDIRSESTRLNSSHTR